MNTAKSLWAMVQGDTVFMRRVNGWLAWQASRVEVEQQREVQKDAEGKMIARLVKETNISRSNQKKVAKK